MQAQPKARSAADGTTLELPADREILITRTFNAPMPLVFDALNNAEHVRRWWSPASRGKMTVCDVDFRVGGGYRFVMVTNSGFEVGFSGKYLEINAPTHVVQTEVFDPFPDAVNRMTVTLSEKAGKTTMVQRSVYPSRAVRDQVISTGMEDGMRESLRQLTDVIASLKP